MKVRAYRTALFGENQDLAAFIVRHAPRIEEGGILAVTSKVVALAEGRVAEAQERDRIIKKESEWAKSSKHVWLTLKDGMLLANAGIDASNANGRLVLLPKDSYESAMRIRDALCRRLHLKKLGVLITDSRVAPLRAGVTGVALGYAGFRGLRDYRGTKDLFGRPLKFTQTNLADCLASAAIVEMGEGGERKPLALITDAPVAFTAKAHRNELKIAPKDDMYAPVLRLGKSAKISRKR